MEERIAVLIISDRRGAGATLAGLLMAEPALRLAGTVSCAEAAALVRRLRPGVVIYEPLTTDPGELTMIEPVIREAPFASVIVVSVAATSEHLRRAMAIGVREYVALPVTAERLAAVVRSVHDQERESRRYRAARGLLLVTERRPRVIAVFSTKGGVGKTTLSVNLAVALARETRHLVPVVDLDQGSGGVSMFLGLARPTPRGGPATAMDPRPADPDLETTFAQIERKLVRHRLNVAVLSPHGCPGRSRPGHIRRVLDLLACGHDLTVIDTYPTVDEAIGAALDLADVVLLVTTPDLPTLHRAGEALAVLSRAHRRPNRPNGKVRLVVNRVGPRAELDPRVIEDYLGLPVFGTVSDAPAVVGRSISLERPFVAARPASRVALDIRALALELLRQ